MRPQLTSVRTGMAAQNRDFMTRAALLLAKSRDKPELTPLRRLRVHSHRCAPACAIKIPPSASPALPHNHARDTKRRTS